MREAHAVVSQTLAVAKASALVIYTGIGGPCGGVSAFACAVALRIRGKKIVRAGEGTFPIKVPEWSTFGAVAGAVVAIAAWVVK
jgi:hypothetical protein